MQHLIIEKEPLQNAKKKSSNESSFVSQSHSIRKTNETTFWGMILAIKYKCPPGSSATFNHKSFLTGRTRCANLAAEEGPVRSLGQSASKRTFTAQVGDDRWFVSHERSRELVYLVVLNIVGSEECSLKSVQSVEYGFRALRLIAAGDDATGNGRCGSADTDCSHRTLLLDYAERGFN